MSTTGHGQDFALQLDELRQVAAQRAWHFVVEHADDGVSRAATSRPARDRAVDTATTAASAASAVHFSTRGERWLEYHGPIDSPTCLRPGAQMRDDN